MKKYYINIKEESIGPFSKEDLIEERITKKTLIRSEGMISWKKAGEIDDLKLILLTIPTAPVNNHKIIKNSKKKITQYTSLLELR